MIIAVDTGGTKTLVARFSKRGALEQSERFETPKDFQEYFAILLKTLEFVSENKKITTICIALPGRIINGEILSHAKNIGWPRDINIKTLLEAAVGCEVFVENDANLAGLAEVRHLSTTPTIGLYVTVSTGIGTGLIVNGELRSEWSPSEGGQIVLERDGVFATWESFASGKAIQKRYGKYGYEIHSKRIWNEIAKDISRGIIALSPVLRPDVIIIGGSIGTYFDQYKVQLNNILHDHLKPHYIPRIVRAEHPEQAVIYGCYLYATEQLNTR